MNYFLRCLPIVAVIVFGALTVLTVSNKEKKLSPILEANVDALATDESGGVSYICYTTFTPAIGSMKTNISSNVIVVHQTKDGICATNHLVTKE